VILERAWRAFKKKDSVVLNLKFLLFYKEEFIGLNIPFSEIHFKINDPFILRTCSSMPELVYTKIFNVFFDH